MSYLCAARYPHFGAISGSVSVSASSGVGPLAVFFDATGVTSTLVEDSFFDLRFYWDFGDGSAGNWSYGNTAFKNKNNDTGAVAAHLYAYSASPYQWTCTVFDGYGYKVYTGTITVSDPDVFYAGAATIVVSSSGTFTGAPAGATQITDNTADNFNNPGGTALGTRAAANTRILYRFDEPFGATGQTTINAANVTIGRFGGSGQPAVDLATATTLFSLGSSCANLKILDLEVDGGSTPPNTFISTASAITGLTVSNCNVHDTGTGISAVPTNTKLTQVYIGDSIIGPMDGTSNAYGVYLNGYQYAILGSHIFTPGATSNAHCIRTNWSVNGVISHNELCATDLLALSVKLSGHIFTVDNSYDQYNVMSDNKITGSTGSPTTCTIGPQNNTANEQGQYFLSERNWYIGASGASGTTRLLTFEWSKCRSRNDVFDHSATAATCVGVKMSVGGVIPVPDDCRVYNASGYTSAATGIALVQIDSTVTNSVVQNCVAYAPSGTGTTTAVSDSGTGTVGAAGTYGNSSNVQVTGTCPFTDTTPTDPAAGDFNPANYALAGGVTSYPVLDGYAGTQRYFGNVQPSIDMGAVQTTVN